MAIVTQEGLHGILGLLQTPAGAGTERLDGTDLLPIQQGESESMEVGGDGHVTRRIVELAGDRIHVLDADIKRQELVRRVPVHHIGSGPIVGLPAGEHIEDVGHVVHVAYTLVCFNDYRIQSRAKERKRIFTNILASLRSPRSDIFEFIRLHPAMIRSNILSERGANRPPRGRWASILKNKIHEIRIFPLRSHERLANILSRTSGETNYHGEERLLFSFFRHVRFACVRT